MPAYQNPVMYESISINGQTSLVKETAKLNEQLNYYK